MTVNSSVQPPQIIEGAVDLEGKGRGWSRVVDPGGTLFYHQHIRPDCYPVCVLDAIRDKGLFEAVAAQDGEINVEVLALALEDHQAYDGKGFRHACLADCAAAIAKSYAAEPDEPTEPQP